MREYSLAQFLLVVLSSIRRRASYKGDGSSLAHGGVALSPDITLPAPRKLSSDSAEPGAPTGPTHPGTPGGRATPGTPGSFRPKHLGIFGCSGVSKHKDAYYVCV